MLDTLKILSKYLASLNLFMSVSGDYCIPIHRKKKRNKKRPGEAG